MHEIAAHIRIFRSTAEVAITLRFEWGKRFRVWDPENSLWNMTPVAAGSTKSRFARDAANAAPAQGHRKH